jgi:hypothetical protein
LGRPGDLVTREELQKELWPEETFLDANHGLNAAVNKLRETLNDVAKDPKYIETLPRRGYRFIGSIESSGHSSDDATVPTHDDLVPTIDPAVRKTPALGNNLLRSSKTGSRSGKFTILIASLLVVFFGAALLVLLTNELGKTRAQLPPPVARASSEVPFEAAETQERVSEQATRHISVPLSSRAVVHRENAKTAAPVFKTIIPGGSGNAAPQISPDGKRIAFISNRSGPWQIWVSYIDGSNPLQLSHTDSAGTPRWSPDGRSIAFDAPSDFGTSIFIAPSDGQREAQRLIEGKVPSFSRDGKWIYFASDRGWNTQVWKIPVTGGEPEKVTRNGGFAALESGDGYIYYSKSPGNNPDICRVSVDGGEEDCSLPHLRPRTWSSWAVTHEGILFVEDLQNNESNLSVYDPDKRQVRDLVSLQSAPVWIGASFDGKRAIVNDSAEQQISLVENLP